MIGEEGNERKEEVGEEVEVVQSHSFYVLSLCFEFLSFEREMVLSFFMKEMM